MTRNISVFQVYRPIVTAGSFSSSNVCCFNGKSSKYLIISEELAILLDVI